MRSFRRKNRQADPGAGAVVTAPQGKRAARTGLARRFKGAMVRRQLARAVGTVPPAAALAVGVAVGIVIGVALVLGTLAELVREAGA